MSEYIRVWVQWTDTRTAGSCNICQGREETKVHEIELGGSIAFRVCQKHAKELLKELQRSVNYVDVFEDYQDV